MIRKILSAGILATAGLLGLFPKNDAFACTKTAGCVMDVFHDDYAMKRDGRMDKAIQAGRENMEAFRELRDAEQGLANRPAQKR